MVHGLCIIVLRTHLLCKAGSCTAPKASKRILARPSTTRPERQRTQRKPVFHSTVIILSCGPAEEKDTQEVICL